jgi:acetate kinase
MILVVNPGSSSIKFCLFDNQTVVIVEGIAERIGLDGRLKIEYQNQKISFDSAMPNHEAAVVLIDQKLQELKIVATPEDIEAIGFRVVHGGQKITQPVLIDQQIQTIIKDAAKLAPLHNPGALTAIQAFEKIFPTSKLVACFDTAFHQTMPLKNYLYPTPYE